MARGIDFKQKEVININNGKILGYVCDVNADFNTGEINSIIITPIGKFFSYHNSKKNIVLEWEKIKKIGEDVILVDYIK